MKKIELIASLAFLVGATAPAMAQQGYSSSGGGNKTTCSTSEAVGYLGISGIDCDCTISSPRSGHNWTFRTEPTITSLEMDSRGATLLRIGDVITAVNGKLITTKEGAQELAELKPGEGVVLTIRRNGNTQRIALTAQSACPNDSRLFSIYAPGRAYGEAPPVPSATMARPGTWSVAQVPTPTMPPAPTVYAARGKAGVEYAWTEPRATFGMGLTCSNCSMGFSERDKTAFMIFSKPPEVYSIERNGPADRAGIRRGDVITRVNGYSVDSDEGGKAFAMAKPGQIVKFTVIRGNDSKVFAVKAAQSQTPRPALAQSTRSLERARDQLDEMQRVQDEQVKRLYELQRTRDSMTTRVFEQQRRELLRQEQEDKRRMVQLAAEMERASREMTSAACTLPPPLAPAATPSARASRTLRYSGDLGDAEIEVRGAPASVTETKDEIVITTSGSVIRISKKK